MIRRIIFSAVFGFGTLDLATSGALSANSSPAALKGFQSKVISPVNHRCHQHCWHDHHGHHRCRWVCPHHHH